MPSPLGLPPWAVDKLPRLTVQVAAILAIENETKPDEIYRDATTNPEKALVTLQKIEWQGKTKMSLSQSIINELDLLQKEIKNKSPSHRVPYKVIERFDTIRAKAAEIIRLNLELERLILRKMNESILYSDLDFLLRLCEAMLKKIALERSLIILIQQEIELLRIGE